MNSYGRARPHAETVLNIPDYSRLLKGPGRAEVESAMTASTKRLCAESIDCDAQAASVSALIQLIRLHSFLIRFKKREGYTQFGASWRGSLAAVENTCS